MLGRILRWCAIIAMACYLLPGCAYFSKSGRRQMAYERYVRKYSGQRAKRQAKYKKVRNPRPPDPSAYKVNAGVSESPQSVSGNQ
jgi:hypothetical protein